MRVRLLAVAFALLFGSPAFAANPTIEIWKSTTCECCGNWVKHLEANGFDVTVHTADTSLLDRVRKDAGIPDKLAACHTAKIDGYFIEGHVPGTDIKRLKLGHYRSSLFVASSLQPVSGYTNRWCSRGSVRLGAIS
jgi:hypothetical protein